MGLEECGHCPRRGGTDETEELLGRGTSKDLSLSLANEPGK